MIAPCTLPLAFFPSTRSMKFWQITSILLALRSTQPSQFVFFSSWAFLSSMSSTLKFFFDFHPIILSSLSQALCGWGTWFQWYSWCINFAPLILIDTSIRRPSSSISRFLTLWMTDSSLCWISLVPSFFFSPFSIFAPQPSCYPHPLSYLVPFLSHSVMMWHVRME